MTANFEHRYKKGKNEHPVQASMEQPLQRQKNSFEATSSVDPNFIQNLQKLILYWTQEAFNIH